MIRPCSCRHDVEWTTSGSSGYHFMTSRTASTGLAAGERPTRSESAWIGFIQTSRPSRSATGRTSRVWATNRGDQSTVEMGGPIASTSGATFGLALRGIGGGGVDTFPPTPRLGAGAGDRAVAAARRSFDSGVWRALPPAERAKVLWRVGDMIEERAMEFAQLDSLDNGMPINDALLFFVPFAAATFRYYAGWVTKLDGATQQISLPGKYLSYTLRQPVGGVGQIIPWK